MTSYATKTMLSCSNKVQENVRTRPFQIPISLTWIVAKADSSQYIIQKGLTLSIKLAILVNIISEKLSVFHQKMSEFCPSMSVKMKNVRFFSVNVRFKNEMSVKMKKCPIFVHECPF